MDETEKLQVALHSEKRFWEIDFLRGVAILMMVLYHLFFDLAVFGSFNFKIEQGFWLLFARTTATLFIFLVGVSLTLSFNRTKQQNRIIQKYLKRGLWILGWGMLITLATWLIMPQSYIRFGILHLIGLAIIIAYPFLRFRKFNLFVGILVMLCGYALGAFNFDFSYLVWFGFMPQGFSTLDYYPVLPWFGIVLIGIFFGNSIYPQGRRAKSTFTEPQLPLTRGISIAGRHSLVIYLVHQPILIAILWLIGLINFSIFS